MLLSINILDPCQNIMEVITGFRLINILREWPFMSNGNSINPFFHTRKIKGKKSIYYIIKQFFAKVNA